VILVLVLFGQNRKQPNNTFLRLMQIQSTKD